MSPTEKQFLLENLRTTISAHNAQPFRIRFLNDSHWEVLAEKSRILPVADPKMKDFWMSFGAFIETLEIILARIGWELKECIPTDRLESKKAIFGVADLQVKQNQSALNKQDFDLLAKRMSYRGSFKKKVKIEISESSPPNTHLKVLTDPTDKLKISQKYDQINDRFLMVPGYVEELYSWMRFSKKHPRWKKDGLDPEAMALSGIDALGAQIILKPAVYRQLSSWGVTRSLISEKSQVMTSSGLVLIASPLTQPIDLGRVFLRGWLELTRMNLYGAPMSIMTDDESSRMLIRKIFNLEEDLNIVNLLRVGPWPSGVAHPKPARISWTELEIK